MEKKEVEKTYKFVQVPTNFAPAIQTPNEEVLSVEEALALILNKLESIEKLIG